LASAITRELAALTLGHYPAFVYRDGAGLTGEDYVPVFCFHTLEPGDFDDRLRYLSGNGYRTVTLDEVYAWMREGEPLPDRPVVLTIDDGRLSTWAVGYPLLRKHGLLATAFIIPGYVTDGAPRPTLEDVWEDRASIEDVSAPESIDRCTMVNWAEVEIMHGSGVMNIESHSMFHRRVPVSTRLAGFITPAAQGPIFEVPMDPGARQPWTPDRLHAALGTPLFESVPLMSTASVCPVPPQVIDACTELVRHEGEAGFFIRPDWHETLRRTIDWKELHRVRPVNSGPDQSWELAASKEEIERRLPGRAVRHFCYPNGRGTERTGALSAGAGYRTCCWNLLPAGETNRRGCDATRIGRLKHDFVYRLPGDGRRSLMSILTGKFHRRRLGDTGY